MAGVNVSIGADSRKAQAELTRFQKKTKSIAADIAKGFKERIGHKLFDGLLSAAAKVPSALGKAVDIASDLNEEISKSAVIFGGAAEEIRKFSQSSVEDLGLSEVAAMTATGQFGNLFKTMGLGEREVSSMSQAMTGLAADLGSFHNTTTEDAIFAIGAALRGESEPIRRYGVLLNEATLKAKAMEMGLYDGKGALDPATKALASYQVILKQTADAQGDFAKTSGELEGQKKILKAQITNLAGEIGAKLLPVVKDMVARLNEADFEAIAKNISKVISVIIDLTPKILALGLAFKAIQMGLFFKNMIMGLTSSIGLWGAETAAVELNTAAKIKNAAVGAGLSGGGKGVLKGKSGLGKLGAIGAMVGTAVGGFQVGKMIGDPLADYLFDDEVDDTSPEAAARADRESGFSNNKERDRRIAESDAALDAAAANFIASEVAKKAAIEKSAEAEKKKLENIKAIQGEYKKTLQLLDARIRGDKKLLEQEEERKQIAEEQKKHAGAGIQLSKEGALKLIRKRKEAEEAERKRAADADALAQNQKGKADESYKKENRITDLGSAIDAKAGQSSLLAVSSMQRIGGGGGSYGMMDHQKTQTDLQQAMVNIMSEIKNNGVGGEISDYG